MKSAIDKLEHQPPQARDESVSSEEADADDSDDYYGEGDDAESNTKKAQQASEDEGQEATPVKNKRRSPVKPRQQGRIEQADQAQVERLRVHYKRQKLEGEGNLGIVGLIEPAPEKSVRSPSTQLVTEDQIEAKKIKANASEVEAQNEAHTDAAAKVKEEVIATSQKAQESNSS